MPTKRRITTAAVMTSPSGPGALPSSLTMIPENPSIPSRIGSSRRSSSSGSSLALPLLEGLCRRPGAADSIMKDAFDQWKASRRIVRNLELLWKEHKLAERIEPDSGTATKKGSNDPPPSKRRRKDCEKEDQEDQQQPQQQQREKENEQPRSKLSPLSSCSPYRDVKGLHWLFQSLASPFIRERKIALKILAMGCPLDDASIRTTIELVVLLIQQGNPSKDADATCMVGWLTLLKLLVVDILSGPERLAYCVRPDIGLPWLCRTLWKVAFSSLRTSQHTGSNTTPVCLTLVDLIHSLVLKGSDHDMTHRIHKVLWSETTRKGSVMENNPHEQLVLLSPLACLMGAYHLWSENHHRINRRIEEKYKTMMEQLIDPSILPKIEPVSEHSGPVSENRGDQRLATFLLSTPEQNTAGAASNGDKEKKTSANDSPKKRGSAKERSLSATSNESNSSNIHRSRPNESRNPSAPVAASPGADSMASSSAMGSPPGVATAERSMVTSVAKLFSSLYGNRAGGEEDIEDPAEHHVDENEEVVDVFHGGDEDDEHMTDEEDHVDFEEDHDDEEQGEAEEGNEADEGEPNTKKDSTSNDDYDEETKTDTRKDNDESSHGSESNSIEDDDEINSEDDEEIDSDEGEDCDDCNSMIEDDEDGHGDEIVIHEDEIPHIEQGLLELQRNFHNRSTTRTLPTSEKVSTADNAYPTAPGGQGTKERSRLYIKAAMEVLAIQHPPISKSKGPVSQLHSNGSSTPLTITAEKALMASIMQIIKPEKKPLNGKIILRRAPTQEEFFRGNLSANPISFSMLNPPSNGDRQEEPTIRDLRQHIANDLQMGDSAELLEVLVANKILDVDLKLRVILQTVWKEHLIQHAGRSSSSTSLSSLLMGDNRGGARSFLSSSSGLSLMLYSSLERSMGTSGSGGLSVTVDTPVEALPPMVMTYRLTGVDGEATEDTVSTLNDPEAPSEASSPEEIELVMEKEYGITRTVMFGRGVFCLLRSVQSNIHHTLQKIRRDGVGGSENHARQIFKQSFYPGLSLLVCCAKLPSNRKFLLQARAPTTLLQLLLDVLDALEDDGSDSSSESNSTATALQELISLLASDIMLSSGDTSSNDTEESEADEDASTLRLLIQAIETSSLSRTLRNVIAKLVPYLTYGKPKLSKELALEFMAHVDGDKLEEYEMDDDSERRNSIQPQSVLTDTFIHASISLPANEVCNSLRMELTKCGFVEQIARYILRDCPVDPPHWSAPLWSRGKEPSKQKKTVLLKQWTAYSKRSGLKTCFEILIGLCKEHESTQTFLGALKEGDVSFLHFCHWLESTSDMTSAGITMKGFGLLAETLLDDIAEFGKPISEEVKMIKSLRRKTRERKKEIAMERRKKSLMSMNKFGALSTSSTSTGSALNTPSNIIADAGAPVPFWAPALDLFRDSSITNTQDGTETEAGAPASKKRKKSGNGAVENVPPTKPDWMKELENMEDETGLTCAVCQEGRKFKSSEMMGLYAYVKKVSLQNGDRPSLDGTNLLTTLPPKLPLSLKDSTEIKPWYESGLAAGGELKKLARSSGPFSSSSSRHRSNYYTTTVTAGNAIHINCHTNARRADRNHPKAPKSEWEGAALRNSRVNCNVIFPLVSSRSSSVSLVSVEQALTEHQTTVANLIGVQPKSNLWNVLHDVRLLLLRMAYGEALNADCGGGSLGSNAQLIYHQLSMAKTFESEAQVDDPVTAQHGRDLCAGFLAASYIVTADDFDSLKKATLVRAIADSSLMSALTCILFHNTKGDADSASTVEDVPHPERRWLVGREIFLRGLLKCAGCRHALAIHNSGCISSRNTGKRTRSRSFVEWDMENEESGETQESSPATSRTTGLTSGRKSTSPKINSSRASIDDFGSALRPMIVYYAMMDQLSSDFVPNHDDERIEECSNRFVEVVESCQKSTSIHELLEKAKITLSHEEIINELQRGMMSA